ncbi:hypothetical protein GW17_00009713, partial [Ensete ventricosum]
MRLVAGDSGGYRIAGVMSLIKLGGCRLNRPYPGNKVDDGGCTVGADRVWSSPKKDRKWTPVCLKEEDLGVDVGRLMPNYYN